MLERKWRERDYGARDLTFWCGVVRGFVYVGWVFSVRGGVEYGVDW